MDQFDKHQLEKNDQQLFTDSFNVCWELLKRKEYYLSERETDIYSKLSLNYGHDMYDAMMIIMNKIMKSNKDKDAVEKSKVESIKIVTAEATRDSGYDDNCDQSNEQQQKQVDKVNININASQDKIISNKRNIPVDKIHSKKRFKADHKENDPIEKEHMIDEGETMKDKTLPVTDDSIDVDKTNNSKDHSIRLEIKPNEITNYFESIFFQDDYQSCSNGVTENADHQENTRTSTGSLVSEKYTLCAEEVDELSFTQDKNLYGNDDDDDNNDYGDNDDDDVVDDDDDDNNSLNQNTNLEEKIKNIDNVSLKEKRFVVKLAIENPTWSIGMLKKHSGCKNIYNHHQVKEWKKQVQQGGSPREKMNCVNNWVLNKCIESQQKGEVLTNEKIQAFGLEAKKIFKPMKFLAGNGWLAMFKKNHEITGRQHHLKINCTLQKKESFSLSNACVPFETKVKVVNLSNDNPHWTLKMLREESGCHNLETMNQLNYWRRVVKNCDKKIATSSSTGKI
ncbi:protein PFC0760c-like [Aphidius gifuensis]|uniref:protein PFC0760c-like n=1 Tax=Aphidius gifuensis TaxID=684658 RepID=UPI001CDC0249|nr:protein PFC0760c-like [Aphidius gifuensis]